MEAMTPEKRADLCQKHDTKNPRSWRGCYSFVFEKYSKEMKTWISVLYDRLHLESITNSKGNARKTD